MDKLSPEFFFHNTTVQDAPGGAENTRCNCDKWQLCLRGNYRHIFLDRGFLT